MNLLDRFLSRVFIQKTQLQLLATACLLISSKYLQCKALCAHRLVMYTDYSVTLDELLVSLDSVSIKFKNSIFNKIIIFQTFHFKSLKGLGIVGVESTGVGRAGSHCKRFLESYTSTDKPTYG